MTSVAQESTCGSCGRVNVDARFCDRCGAPLVAGVNPYAPPIAEAADTEAVGLPLASRGARLGAAMIDAVAVTLVNAPLLMAAGLVGFDRGPLPLSRMVLATGLGFLVFTTVQGFFLLHGYTLGKRLLGLRMVDVDTGRSASFGRLLGMRYLPLGIAGLVPIVGSLVALIDMLMIFRPDRRCLHDLLANTRVVSER